MMSERAPRRAHRVALQGLQTVQTIAASRTKLSRALDRYVKIDVDVSETTEADVSLVQLLLAATQSAAQAGKTLRLVTPVSDAVRAVLDRSGVPDTLMPMQAVDRDRATPAPAEEAA